jgi:hypothetical protein
MWPHVVFENVDQSFRNNHNLPQVKTNSADGSVPWPDFLPGWIIDWERESPTGRKVVYRAPNPDGNRTLVCRIPGDRHTYWLMTSSDEELLKKLAEDI